jgi:glycosyltransferase involved in cell wall biosynthesis
MSCGCPVVTSSTGGTPEVVGDAALMVDPTSVDEIYRAAVKVLEDEALRAGLISKGFAQAKNFSWEESARKTLLIFKEIIRGKEILKGKE